MNRYLYECNACEQYCRLYTFLKEPGGCPHGIQDARFELVDVHEFTRRCANCASATTPDGVGEVFCELNDDFFDKDDCCAKRRERAR